jgi:hypothetical protein
MRKYYEDFVTDTVLTTKTKEEIMAYMNIIEATDAHMHAPVFTTPILKADDHCQAMERMGDAVEILDDAKELAEAKILIACEQLKIWEVRSWDLWPVIMDRHIRMHEDSMDKIRKAYKAGNLVGDALQTIARHYMDYEHARRAEHDILDMMKYANKVYSRCDH